MTINTHVRQTSIEVYRQIEKDGLLAGIRWNVYKVMYQHGPMTSAECNAKMKGLGLIRTDERTPSQIRARFTELVQMGCLQELPQRKCKVTENLVIEYDVTDRFPVPLPKKRKKSEIIDQLYQYADLLGSYSTNDGMDMKELLNELKS